MIFCFFHDEMSQLQFYLDQLELVSLLCENLCSLINSFIKGIFKNWKYFCKLELIKNSVGFKSFWVYEECRWLSVDSLNNLAELSPQLIVGEWLFSFGNLFKILSEAMGRQLIVQATNRWKTQVYRYWCDFDSNWLT